MFHYNSEIFLFPVIFLNLSLEYLFGRMKSHPIHLINCYLKESGKVHIDDYFNFVVGNVETNYPL